ncbi:alpha/beta fold hydrolase [Nocardia transvalensis]|uniref:alpha/beta fold hydrolase n=1 Tax=Nocardia transvalensis TaxID=37333 RepID=UPI0018937585|nr:alpha/beta hydrolase [Nocardia transvalensis]MBF6327262.1 alpha/beta hydrolase [Nocardia transvalensis]
MVQGSEGPTVVFESGMGFSRSIWGLVQPLVAGRMRTAVYDRAGIGRSDDAAHPRTLGRMAADLDTVLRALGPGPFVLVGHSWGGPIARVAAAADPSRIRGLVLVDQSDENCELYFTRSARTRFATTRLLMPALARIGLYRSFGSKAGAAQPVDVLADHRAEDFTVRAARALIAEQDLFLAELQRLREHPLVLDSVEVSVITGTGAQRFDKTVRQAIIAAHRRTAEALPNGRLVEAPRSGHLVMFTEPDVVAREILRVAGPSDESAQRVSNSDNRIDLRNTTSDNDRPSR